MDVAIYLGLGTIVILDLAWLKFALAALLSESCMKLRATKVNVTERTANSLLCLPWQWQCTIQQRQSIMSSQFYFRYSLQA